MPYYNNIIETIGQTPLVRLNRIAAGYTLPLCAKLECFNPGNSVKDRMAAQIIADAEARGDLKPGGLIIEATSGNTGAGLAMVAAAKGYRCLLTISDKQAAEKINVLKALGAEVVICPSQVEYDDPQSYLSTAKRLASEHPDAYFPFQYDNLSNTEAHYKHTGPEVWTQTDQQITHLVAGVGTGGTISGIAKYIKEQNPAVQVIGVEPEGSIFARYKQDPSTTPPSVPHYTEGIGSDFIPKNVLIEYIDEVLEVSDKDAAYMARALAKTEGLFLGWSSGAVAYAALQYAQQLTTGQLVMIMPDHGSRYINKIYNDTWLKSKGYWEENWQPPTWRK